MTFGFMRCPLCSAELAHDALEPLLEPARALRERVEAMALRRLALEGMQKDAALVAPGARYQGNALGYAMDALAYYECGKCAKPYFGGRRACGDAPGAGGGGVGSQLQLGRCARTNKEGATVLADTD